MKYEVSHRTTYRYLQPVAQSRHVLHLEPRSTGQQSIIHHGVLIEPAPVAQVRITDYFGNPALLLRIDDEHQELVVHARCTVELRAPPARNLDATVAWERVLERASRPNALLDIDVLQYALPSRHTPVGRDIATFASRFFSPGRPVLAGAMDLTTAIFREFLFDPSATDVSTPIQRVLEERRGVCQDFAHVALAALRSRSIPARYTSGYLLTRPPPGQQKLRGADASHAWLSVWAPETGWVDFDPTNGVIPTTEHITIAWGRDYDDISPISGVLLGGGEQTMAIAVDVDPVA